MLASKIESIFAFFERRIDPYQAYDDTKPPPSNVWDFYKEFLYPARWVLGIGVAIGLCVGVADAVLIYLAGDVVDRLRTSTPETVWAEHGGAFLMMLGLLLIVRPILIVLERLLLGQSFFPNMGALIRWRTHRHVLRQSVGFFNDDFAGRIANKQMQLAPAFNDIVFQMNDAIAYAVVFLITSAVLFGGLDLRLLAPLAVWLVLFIGTAWFFVPKIVQIGKEVADARSNLAGRIVDSYTNIQTVKLFAHAAREEHYARDALEDMRGKFKKMTRLYTWLSLALTLVNVVLIGGTVGYAIYLWSGSNITIGVIAGASAAVLRLQAMTDWIMWTLTMLFENIGVVMEGVEKVSEPLRLTDKPGAPALAVSHGAIRFEGVCHRYGREAAQGAAGVEAIDLEIKPGEKVGLVGYSGAGKSTLVNLLLRFFDPDEGRILIDGQDVGAVRQDSLRAAIGMVTQDTSLLHRSILDNIVYGWPELGDMKNDAERAKARAAAEAAARRVAADAFIATLEDRDGRKAYEAFVGERGVKLSGGQRQRVALARVVLKDAPILVLDEATSALDSEVEAAILDALAGLMEGKTVIAIAHRLSTIAQMDRIVVLDQGRVIEDGPHDALLAQGGLYAQLWTRQSGGFIGGGPRAKDPARADDAELAEPAE